MFDKIIDFLIDMIEKIMPVFIINQFDAGILLRRGLFKKVVNGGIHFKIPFLDEVFSHTITPTTEQLPAQSLTTKDGKSIVVQGIIKYEVANIKTFLLEVWDATDAISDTTQGVIKDVIMGLDIIDIGTDIDSIITKKAKIEAAKWGIKIHKVTLTNIGLIKSIRLFNDSN